MPLRSVSMTIRNVPLTLLSNEKSPESWLWSPLGVMVLVPTLSLKATLLRTGDGAGGGAESG